MKKTSVKQTTTAMVHQRVAIEKSHLAFAKQVVFTSHALQVGTVELCSVYIVVGMITSAESRLICARNQAHGRPG